MNFSIHWISKKYCELSVDAINTGALDAGEAKQLALELTNIIQELLSLEDKK